MTTALRVLIAAGGTGGHVFPALAVAQELRRRGWHAEWVGTNRGLESRVIPASGIGLHILRFEGLRGKGIAAWLSLPIRLWRALSDARQILAQVRPQVVLAFGGYVTFPVGLAARLRQLPLCIHEQNAVMGSANRWLARIAKRVMVSFPQTKFAPADAMVSGNPVRQTIVDLGRASQHSQSLDSEHEDAPIRLFVVGGSLGARAFNQTLPQAMELALKKGARFEITHQTGAQDLAGVTEDYRARNIKARCMAFVERIEEIYAWADLVLARAGASTVTELACAAKPAIFVPLPNAIDDHQTANARFLSDAKAAILLPQSELCAERLAHLLCGLTRAELREMSARSFSRAMSNATSIAANEVEALARYAGGPR